MKIDDVVTDDFIDELMSEFSPAALEAVRNIPTDVLAEISVATTKILKRLLTPEMAQEIDARIVSVLDERGNAA